MLNISPATMDELGDAQMMRFVQRTAAFLHEQQIATHVARSALEEWIQKRAPVIQAEGLSSEQAIVFVLAIEATYGCDVFNDSRTAPALAGNGRSESTRLDGLRFAIESQFPAPQPGGVV